MKHPFLAVIAATLLSSFSMADEFVLSPDNPLDARAMQIVKMIDAKPCAPLPSIADREAWAKIAQTGNGQKIIKQAEEYLGQPMPEITDELYRQFSTNGNRTNCQNVINARHRRFVPLVMAEAIENKGRFIPELEKTILAYCDEKSWVLPAHDGSCATYDGKGMNVDLVSSAHSWEYAVAYTVLGDKLSQEVRKTLMDNLERRTFQPYEKAVKTGKFAPLWWIKGDNNWNAVCQAGVCGTALAAIDDPARRAWYIAVAEKYIQNFVHGFTPDGYCSEGLGYWSYGFGHYILLAETVRSATHGQINLFKDEFCEKIAKFPLRIQIMAGISPAFADCGIGANVPKVTQNYLAHVYGWKISQYNDDELTNLNCSYYTTKGLYSNTENFAKELKPVGMPIRDYFDVAGILVCRPCADPVANKADDKDWNKLAMAMKAGHNGEFHNHNDVGSYTIVYRGKAVLLDVGGETYTRRTFSGHRYDSRVLNSWGHAVPMIDGKLQATGSKAKGSVTKAEFSDDQDVFAFDYKSCYNAVKGIKKLDRTFVYDRKNNTITITDEFQMEGENKVVFDSALMTITDAKRDGNAIIVGNKEAQVRVTVEATTTDEKGNVTPVDWSFTSELCGEDQGKLKTSRRLGVVLPAVNNATVKFTITPME